MVSVWQIDHVKKVENSAVYCLAKAAVKDVIDKVWMKDFPSYIFYIVLLE
jgi:hypothetical protein